MKYRVVIGPLSATSYDAATLARLLADPDSGFMALSFGSEEQLTRHFSKAEFPNLVSGQPIESPNGRVTTYYSLLERENDRWIGAKTDPR